MAARTMPSLPTFFAGQRLTGGTMQSITTWGNFWADRPTFSMYQSASQTVANNTGTQITCDTGQWDSDTGRSVSTPFSFTIPAWGSGMRWRFSYLTCWQSSNVGTRWSYLKQNGSFVVTSLFQTPAGADPVSVGGTRSVVCNGGDVITLWGGQTSGGNLGTSFVNLSFFEGWLEGLGTP